MRKIYKLSLRAKLGVFALAMTVLSGTVFSQTTYTFNYTGGTQTISLAAGIYSIECWGADGGTNTSNSGTTPGKGGYSSGSITLTTTTTFTIRVGGKGNGGSQPLGGYNSGNGTTKTNLTTATGGGGASDIRVLADNLFNRIIVAGGGGGQGNTTGTGGHGGGLTGQNGQGTVANIGMGGTQTAPGVYPGGGDSKPAAFGEGSDGPAGTTGGQGGGGWYGGSFGTRTNGGGGGGSGYVLTSTSFTPTGYFSAHTNYYFSNAVTYRADETGFVANPVATGNGLVLIRELCAIDLYATGATSSVSPVICAGQSLTLTTDAVSNYSWSTGATGTNSIIVSPTTNTMYAVSATSSMSCTTTRSITVLVNSAVPSLTVSATSNSICLGDSVSITTAGAVSYTYTGGISNGTYFYPAATGNYSVTGGNACGVTNSFVTVTVTPLPVGAVAMPTIVCAGSPATLTAAGAQNYSWMPAGFGSSIVVSPPSSQVYTVTGQDGACVATATVEVQTNPVPVLSISASNSMICQGDSAILQVTGASSYSWQDPGLSGSTVVVKPTQPAAFTVFGTNAQGCSSSIQQIVLVNVSPTVALSANPATICVGGTTTLSASGAHTYVWSDQNTGSTNMVSPVTTMTYSATGTETVNGCQNTAVITVNVFQATISATPSSSICPGDVVLLNAGSAISYTWSTLGNQPSYTVSPTATTVYTLNVIKNEFGQTCEASNHVTITVNPVPQLTITTSRDTACKNEPVSFQASGANTYKWSNGSTTASFTLTALATVPFQYTVTGTDNNGCKATKSVVVPVLACTGINEQNAGLLRVYPNPNNGAFVIETTQPVNVTIFNELGQVVKEIPSVLGKFSISGLTAGLYFVQAENNAGISRMPVIIH